MTDAERQPTDATSGWAERSLFPPHRVLPGFLDEKTAARLLVNVIERKETYAA